MTIKNLRAAVVNHSAARQNCRAMFVRPYQTIYGCYRRGRMHSLWAAGVYIVRLRDVIVSIYHGSGVLFVAKLEASVSEHKP